MFYPAVHLRNSKN